MADEEAKPDSKEPKAAKAPADEKNEPQTKPVSKAVEWALAIAIMAVLVGFLAAMIYLMRGAKNGVMM